MGDATCGRIRIDQGAWEFVLDDSGICGHAAEEYICAKCVDALREEVEKLKGRVETAMFHLTLADNDPAHVEAALEALEVPGA